MQTWRAGANPEGFTGDQIAKLNEEAKPEEIRLITDEISVTGLIEFMNDIEDIEEMANALADEAEEDSIYVISECAGLLNAIARSAPELLTSFNEGLNEEDRNAVIVNFADVAPELVDVLGGGQPA